MEGVKSHLHGISRGSPSQPRPGAAAAGLEEGLSAVTEPAQALDGSLQIPREMAEERMEKGVSSSLRRCHRTSAWASLLLCHKDHGSHLDWLS